MKIGTVYKISSPQTPKFYIGSTCQKYLSSRLYNHKVDIERGKGATSKHILCFPDAIIEPLCYMKFTNRSELRAIEYQVMKQYGNQVVNHNGLQDRKSSEYPKKYYQKNKEAYQAHYQKNKEAITTWKKTVVNCDHCNKHYTKSHKSRHYKKYHLNIEI